MSTENQASLIYGFLVRSSMIESPVTNCKWQLKSGDVVIAISDNDENFHPCETVEGLEIFSNGIYEWTHDFLGVLIMDTVSQRELVSQLTDLTIKPNVVVEFARRYSLTPAYFLIFEGY